MTTGQWQNIAEKKIKKAGVSTYYLEGLILLEYVTRFERAYILAHQDKELTAEQILELKKLLTRRCKREPIAYITGKKEFYGREFIVNKNVLIPRPESESFIDLLKKHKVTHQYIIDVGCGSGILGITTSLELPSNKVTLSDIDEKAMKIAKQNAKKLNAKCSFIQSDLLPANSNYTVILANLPYVPKNLNLEPELNFEPTIALFADNRGVSLYRDLWEQISQNSSVYMVLTESLKTQHKLMKALAVNANYELLDTDGLVQLFKRV